MPDQKTALEFFAGVGLVRKALEPHFRVVFANDIDPVKRRVYEANFGDDEFHAGDIAAVDAAMLPAADVATASFPCTDLSLAGQRAGLSGNESRSFWEFIRILRELGAARPRAVLLENVVGFATSHGGADLEAAISALNQIGYRCDPFVLDASRFVAQSRPRLFVVGLQGPRIAPRTLSTDWLRPHWVSAFANRYPHLDLQALRLREPPRRTGSLTDCVERMPADDSRWWSTDKVRAFLDSLSDSQRQSLRATRTRSNRSWSTAYRRTRGGRAVWEMRWDGVAGCLRTARGGSSRQAIAEIDGPEIRVRWMTATEYACLQGAPGHAVDGVSENQALSAFGDAVCVPAVSWIAESYLVAVVDGKSPAYEPPDRSGIMVLHESRAILRQEVATGA